MSTNLGNSMAMTRNLVLNNQKSTSYDVYLNYKGVNTTDSVFTKEPKSNTFLNTGRVVIGSKHIVAQRPEMDSDAALLQDALLYRPTNSQYSQADSALILIFIGLCFYVAVSLVIWGSI